MNKNENDFVLLLDGNDFYINFYKVLSVTTHVFTPFQIGDMIYD